MVILFSYLTTSPFVTPDSTERVEHMKTYKKQKSRQNNTVLG